MIELMQSIFGTYTPNTYTEYIYDAAGNLLDSYEVVASGAAGVDWSYIGGVAIFAIALLCVFKLIGTLLKNG